MVSPARQRQIAAEANLRQLASQHTAKAVRTLVELIDSKETPPAAKVAAVRELLDRAHGKPAQSVEIRQNRDASEYSDADLYAIAGLGSARVVAPQGSAPEPDQLH